MKTEEKLLDNQNLIFEVIKNLNLNKGSLAELNSRQWKSFCTDQTKKLDYYVQNWRNYFLKDYSGKNGVNTDFINNDVISNLFADKKILNVFYFEVWGDVLEHKDPKAFDYGYPEKIYNTFLMPISIPSNDSNIFKTFYNKKIVNLEEGKFIKWDVSGVPHYWEFDYLKVNKFFKLLHIDYIN